ncbi:macro domain-containing protein [Candidatus Pacearchaeota archaeon]|nr:macro domain-containing protein [Candidatus Pacearchaeota archaeon]MBD3283651.1 macro domain-containing protein [Candidatus Pacearchaeota archaeon]
MIEVILGDITNLEVDSIVNAANENMVHGGGVAEAIADAAGEEFIKESRDFINKRGRLKVGDAVYTGSGNLKNKGVKYVIHAVGPRGGNKDLLEKVVRNIFELAKRIGVRSIALPAVSCGIFGFDKKLGSKLIFEISKEHEGNFKKIILISLDKEIIDYWNKLK